MVIKVLGTGCPKCKATEENVKKALADMRKEAEIVKVTNIDDIVKYNVMMTPALVINEKVRVFGRVPNATEIAQWIAEESAGEN